MKLLTLLTTTTLLFLSSAVAAPVDAGAATTDASSDGLDATAISTAANNGSPHCKSIMMEDLCLSDNADAYCDVTGFHNNFMKSCAGNCFCS